jgi:glutamine amidotransferase
MQRIAVIDYGSGNLHSVGRALHAASTTLAREYDIRVTDDAHVVRRADRIVLPGQGAFRDCMQNLLNSAGMIDALQEVVIESGRPFLGICVGMQLLMRVGLEHGETHGLNWIDGVCAELETQERLPHMGWSGVRVVGDHPVLAGLAPERAMYFAHSFCVAPRDEKDVAARSDHGGAFASAIGRGPMLGVQFHPEKSQAAGLDLLRRFLSWSP